MEAYKNPQLTPEERADDLLSRMTLREKIGQLTQRLYGFGIYTRNGDEITFNDEFYQEVERYSGLGTLYGLYRADPWANKNFETGLDGALSPKARNMVQKYVIEHSRFGIPVLMSTECPHGHQALDGYLLPVNLASGATFSPEVLAEAAKISAKQLKEMGVDLALISCLDMLRDPRWGRSEECFGEDPYLASRMAEAVVKAVQGEGVDVTAKHMCAQGETTGGVNASAARIGPHELREIHLPPVKACVDSGVSSFMAAYNEIDGVYCHGNRWLLTDLLRDEYGFKGFVMSDGVAIDQLDAVTGDRTASGALALNAGVDMGLWDTGFQQLEEAVEQGLVDEAKIDEAAKRILTVKFRRGLFENPYVPETDDWKSYTAENYPQVKNLAEQSVVLLKNEGNLLPLNVAEPLRIAMTGPNADAMYNQLGDYTPPIREGVGSTPLTGMLNFISANEGAVQLRYTPGCRGFAYDELPMEQAVELAKDSDIVVAVLGGTSSRFTKAEFDANGALKRQDVITMDCGENVDDAYIRLPGGQLELLKRLKETGTKIVTVLIGGRPYEMDQIHEWSDAILCAFYPGLTGGEALAKLIFGAVEPAGRLPVTMPDHVGQLPVYYNAKDSYRPMRYYNSKKPPRYRFGCGQSYTSFAWNLVNAPADDHWSVTASVRNDGQRPGWVVPQLYIHRTQGVVTSRIRQLCGFDKLYLQPGEEREFTISIPAESLQQWDGAMNLVVPHGKIEWFLGDSGEEVFSGTFIV